MTYSNGYITSILYQAQTTNTTDQCFQEVTRLVNILTVILVVVYIVPSLVDLYIWARREKLLREMSRDERVLEHTRELIRELHELTRLAVKVETRSRGTPHSRLEKRHVKQLLVQQLLPIVLAIVLLILLLLM